MFTEHFVRRESPSLESYVWNSEWSKESKLEVILNFNPKVHHRLLDGFHPDQILVLDDGSIQVKGQFADDEWLYGMLLSYGDYVKVEHPASVAEEIVIRAHNIIGRYSN